MCEGNSFQKVGAFFSESRDEILKKWIDYLGLFVVNDLPKARKVILIVWFSIVPCSDMINDSNAQTANQFLRISS